MESPNFSLWWRAHFEYFKWLCTILTFVWLTPLRGHSLSEKGFSKVEYIASGSRLANPVVYIHPISAKLINVKLNPPYGLSTVRVLSTYSRVLVDECLIYLEKAKSGYGHFLHGVLAGYLKAWQYKILCPLSCLPKSIHFIWQSTFSV